MGPSTTMTRSIGNFDMMGYLREAHASPTKIGNLKISSIRYLAHGLKFGAHSQSRFNNAHVKMLRLPLFILLSQLWKQKRGG